MSEMNEMLRRVTDAAMVAEKDWWNSDAEPEISLAETVARAAIAAMREPTDSMLAVGYGHCGETSGSDDTARTIWRDMIDEASR